MTTIDLGRVPSFYHNYIRAVDARDVREALDIHLNTLLPFLRSLPSQKWDYRYAEGKWTIKDLVQHIIDAERIFNYRALRFARRDAQSLPGFDEDSYVIHAHAAQRTPAELMAELELVQQSSAFLFSSFTEEDLEAEGLANEKSIYVKAIVFITVGHSLHHLNIIRERYL